MNGKNIFHVLGLYLDKLERAFQLDSTDMVRLYHEKAASAIKRGAYDSAISQCQKALKVDADDVEAH